MKNFSPVLKHWFHYFFIENALLEFEISQELVHHFDFFSLFFSSNGRVVNFYLSYQVIVINSHWIVNSYWILLILLLYN